MYTKITTFVLLALVFASSAVTPAMAASLEEEFARGVSKAGISKKEQAVCIANDTGVVVSHNGSLRIIPASVSKLYTFDLALSKLPLDFRYQTVFIQNGQTLYINGGKDPHFVIEHLRKVLSGHTGSSISKIVVSPDFYFNWKSEPTEVVVALQEALVAEQGLPVSSSVQITAAATAYSGKGTRYTFSSMPLPALLKQINNYSTNISADTLFARLGGSAAMSAYLKETYGVGSETAFFGTGSGLTSNYTTCDLTVRVIKHLAGQIKAKGLSAADILSMPVIDPGVLQKRAIDEALAHSLVAKSGFVNNHHALAGIIATKDTPLYFAVFTDFPSEKKSVATKTMIDAWVEKVLKNYRKTLAPFAYTPNPSIFEDVKVVQK